MNGVCEATSPGCISCLRSLGTKTVRRLMDLHVDCVENSISYFMSFGKHHKIELWPMSKRRHCTKKRSYGKLEGWMKEIWGDRDRVINTANGA